MQILWSNVFLKVASLSMLSKTNNLSLTYKALYHSKPIDMLEEMFWHFVAHNEANVFSTPFGRFETKNQKMWKKDSRVMRYLYNFVIFVPSERFPSLPGSNTGSFERLTHVSNALTFGFSWSLEKIFQSHWLTMQRSLVNWLLLRNPCK